jgi:hypothetical protein
MNSYENTKKLFFLVDVDALFSTVPSSNFENFFSVDHIHLSAEKHYQFYVAYYIKLIQQNNN